jgi:alkylation response protein AidB-like acyl-CoA dehydrogenase
MDFSKTHDQELYQNTVTEFARTFLSDDVVGRDHDGMFSRDAWKKCAEFGIQGLPVPEKYGGTAADALTTVLAMEALGLGCRDNGLIFSLNAQMWACESPIVRFGSPEQKSCYLPRLCDGSLIASHAMSEPESGSDAFALQTTAVESGGEYVLNGSKIFATNAPVADLFLVFATLDRSRGFAGVSAFLIERNVPGLSVGSPIHKMGLRTSPMAEVFMQDCRVPVDCLLGKHGAGAAMFHWSMERERSFILASVVGTMAWDLERSIRYARERSQFGQAIGKFQSVANRIVNMKLRLETARLLLYRLGWLMTEGQNFSLESALTKLHLSECFVQSSLDALQVFGGYGYMSEYEVERDVRDAIGSLLYSGTTDMQKNLVARHLGL